MKRHRAYFSVVIPTCHRNDLLALCLERLGPWRQEGMELLGNGETLEADKLIQKDVPDGVGWEREVKSSERNTETSQLSEFPLSSNPRYEVIVTDDGLDTSAQAMVRERFPWARWSAGPRRGPAANRNHGASLGRGAWLVFTDDDCLPDATWLSAFWDRVRDAPETKVYEGATRAVGEKRRLDEIAPINESGGFLWSCNFAIERTFFEALAGFDEDYPGACMEDVDLRVRIGKRSERPCFVPEAVVFHPWRRGLGWAASLRYWRSFFLFLRKHPEESRFRHAECHLRYTWNGLKEAWKYLTSGRIEGLYPHLLTHGNYIIMAAVLLLQASRGNSWRKDRCEHPIA